MRRACSSRSFEVWLPTTTTIARLPLRLAVRTIEEPPASMYPVLSPSTSLSPFSFSIFCLSYTRMLLWFTILRGFPAPSVTVQSFVFVKRNTSG